MDETDFRGVFTVTDRNGLVITTVRLFNTEHRTSLQHRKEVLLAARETNSPTTTISTNGQSQE